MQYTVRAIIEMLGAPKEHLEETLKSYVAKWKDEGIDIKKEDYAETTEEGKLFRCFVELEIQFKTPMDIMGFVLDALPASIEIVEPETLEVPAQDLTAILNDMTSRVHEADMFVKNTRSQMQLLDRNAVNTFRNFIRYVCKTKQSVSELSQTVGLGEEQLKPFLDKMVEENLLNLVGDCYESNDNTQA